VPASDEIQVRIAALEDEQAIIRLMHRYCHTADQGGDFGAIFTDDGVFDVTMADGRKIRRYEGLPAIREYWRTRETPPGRFDKHLVLSPVVTVDGDRARAVSDFVVLQDTADRVLVTYGRYHDTLVRQDGAWRLCERRSTVETLAR